MTNELAQAAMDLDNEATPEITVSQADTLLVQLRDLRTLYDEAKANASEIYKEVEAKEMELLNVLDALDRDSYSLPGIGVATKVLDKSFKMPESPLNRELLFKYINDKYGKDVLYKYTTIHHAALNSFIKEEIKNGSQVPGMDVPTPTSYLRFTKR